MEAHAGDQVPNWVAVDDLLDSRLDVHLQDLDGDGTLRVQMPFPWLKSEQPVALGPTLANRHAQTPDIRLEAAARVLDDFHIHQVLVESVDHLWSEIGHRSWGVTGFEGGGGEVGEEGV